VCVRVARVARRACGGVASRRKAQTFASRARARGDVTAVMRRGRWFAKKSVKIWVWVRPPRKRATDVDDLARIVIVIAASEKNLEVMRKFSEQYARGSGTYFCMDKSVTAVVIQGLAEHKDTLGAPLCPCRHYDDKEAEVANGFWNCPCVPMRERKECHCMLFLTEDNDFAGEEQTITTEELIELTEDM
jgi:ferredoxin-thioredoxin reductase catalytic chain